jgi:hypothetical protein
MCQVDGFQLVLDPVAQPAEVAPAHGAGRRVEGTMRGKQVGIVDNRMTGMSALADALTRVLVDAYGVKRVHYWMVPHSITPDPSTLTTIAQTVDVAVLGLGNCGACTTWECAVSASLREAIPTLDVVTEPFEEVARTAFRGHGLPEQPLAVLPPGADHAAPTETMRFAEHVAGLCASALTTAGDAA